MFFNSHFFSALFAKKRFIVSVSIVVLLVLCSQFAYAQAGSVQQNDVSTHNNLASSANQDHVKQLSNHSSVAVVDTFASLEQELVAAKLKQALNIIERMQTVDAEKALPLFESLLAGELYYRRDTKALFRAVANDEGEYQLFDVMTLEKRATLAKSAIKKVRTNNKLRKNLRSRIASLTLFSQDVEQRLSSATNMMGNLDAANVCLLYTSPSPRDRG